MADYNVQMKQYNGAGFDNVYPYASVAQTLAGGGSASEVIAQARNGLGQIATGSYVGTGTIGGANINIGFRPKFFFFSRKITYSGKYGGYKNEEKFMGNWSFDAMENAADKSATNFYGELYPFVVTVPDNVDSFSIISYASMMSTNYVRYNKTDFIITSDTMNVSSSAWNVNSKSGGTASGSSASIENAWNASGTTYYWVAIGDATT